MDHLSENQIIEYLLDTQPEELQLVSEDHLEHCSDCRDRLTAVRPLIAEIHSALQAFSPAAYGQVVRAVRDARLAGALRALAAGPQSAVQRIRDGLGNLGRSVTHVPLLALNVLVDHTRRLANLAAVELPDDYKALPLPAAAGVGSSRSQTIEEAVASSRRALAAENSQQAAHGLLEASQLRPDSVAAATQRIRINNLDAAWVTVDSQRRRLEIRVAPSMMPCRLPIAVLVPHQAGKPALATAFQADEEGEGLVGSIQEIPDGTFAMMLLEAEQ
jgi:hypothetical protein